MAFPKGKVKLIQTTFSSATPRPGENLPGVQPEESQDKPWGRSWCCPSCRLAACTLLCWAKQVETGDAQLLNLPDGTHWWKTALTQQKIHSQERAWTLTRKKWQQKAKNKLSSRDRMSMEQELTLFGWQDFRQAKAARTQLPFWKPWLQIFNN